MRIKILISVGRRQREHQPISRETIVGVIIGLIITALIGYWIYPLRLNQPASVGNQLLHQLPIETESTDDTEDERCHDEFWDDLDIPAPDLHRFKESEDEQDDDVIPMCIA